MKIIPRHIHGLLDYPVALLVIALPWLSGVAAIPAAMNIAAALGGGAIIYSVLTRYEAGAIRIIPFGTHMILDVMAGLLLAVSPWLFGFSQATYLPYVVVGIAEAAVALMTRLTPDFSATKTRLR